MAFLVLSDPTAAQQAVVWRWFADHSCFIGTSGHATAKSLTAPGETPFDRLYLAPGSPARLALRMRRGETEAATTALLKPVLSDAWERLPNSYYIHKDGDRALLLYTLGDAKWPPEPDTTVDEDAFLKQYPTAVRWV